MLHEDSHHSELDPEIHFENNEVVRGNSNRAKGAEYENHTLEMEMDYDRIFELVKKDVKSHFAMERGGLGLALSNMPAALGAYWQVGGNYIVINESLVKAMTVISKSAEEFNSYVYVILMHEYLHSLGYLDETEARKATASVVTSIFPKEHFAYLMSTGDIWTLYPQLKYVRGGDGSDFRVVSNFGSSSTSYIG